MIRAGSRVVLGGLTARRARFGLEGANSKINSASSGSEASGRALISRISDATVEVKGRLVQAGGQISIDAFPAEINLSNGEMKLTVERLGGS